MVCPSLNQDSGCSQLNSQEPTAAGAGCWGADAYCCQGVAPVEKGPEAPGKRHAADFMGTTPSGGTGSGGWDRAPLPHFSPPMEAARRKRTLGRGKKSWARTGKQYPEVHSAGLWREVVTWGAGAQQRQAELVTTVALSSGSCSIRTPPSKAICLVKQPEPPNPQKRSN